MLITNMIKEKTSIIKTFSQNEAASKKSAEQKNIDANFKEVIIDVNRICTEVINTCDNSRFIFSQSIKEQFIVLLTLCSNCANKPKVEVIDNNGISSKVKELRSSLQYEWSDYHKEETASVEEVLNIIKGIANVDVNAFLTKIRDAKDWNTDVNSIIEMMSAIEEANNQIDKMKLTDTTVAFLKKVIGKTATLEDLSDEVMAWLKEEGIRSKVKISF